jgi:outer membrane biogenesis lipoprotein LolB
MLFLQRFAVACMLAVLITGCTALWKPPVDDARARFLLGRLAVQNDKLKQFKGLAKIRMEAPGAIHSGRIAYAAVRPDKLRVELLNTLGTPLDSLAGDGEYITIRSHVKHKHFRMRQSHRALEGVLQLPLGLEDLLLLLSGRVPLPVHAAATIAEPDGPLEVVVLKSRWHAVVARLRFDARSHQIRGLASYDGKGALQYDIQWHQWKKIKGFTLPAKVAIESASHQRLLLWMDRFWPNPAIAPSIFVLDAAQPRS